MKRSSQLVVLPEPSCENILGTAIDLVTRTVYLVGGVDEQIAYRFLVGFRKLDESPGDIRIVLASPGGSEPDGYAIYDTIRCAQNRVTIDCYGAAQSIAALILQAGDLRRVSPETRIMIHNGAVEFNGGVNAGTLVAIGEEVGRNNLRYQTLIAERSGLPLSQVIRYCEKETYFDAQAAVTAGLADEIINYSEKLPAESTKKPARSNKMRGKK